MEMPKTARGRRTRDRILRVAADLILERGVAATSVDDVLAGAEAGKSQFYHYFQGKNDLVRAVLQYRQRESMEELGPILERLDTWEGIRTWFQVVVEEQERRGFVGGCPIGSLAAETADRDRELRPALGEALRQKGEYLKQGLETMRSRGEIRADADPDRLACFVTALLQGGLLLASVEKDRRPLEEALEEGYRHLEGHAASPREGAEER